ncbi:MAG TPA: methyltransferase domain-containing protein [Mycobacteriales bacterium]|nr:methyltransferase domain-containing protein [Mycobacteriales bacterium]
MSSWQDDTNARRYADFVREFPMYRQSSDDLVRRLELRPGDRVLDLACGTGATTRALLDALGPTGRVIALDASDAMQDLARQQIDDDRVTWILGPAEHLPDLVDGPIDAAVCNSAIWQLDTSIVIPAVARLIEGGGRFTCNVAAPDGSRRSRPTLFELMHAFAVVEHDYTGGPGRRPRHRDQITDQLHDNGFTVTEEIVEFPSSVEETLAWMRIPIFTERMAGLTYEQRMDSLDKAAARLDPAAIEPHRWLTITAIKR